MTTEVKQEVEPDIAARPSTYPMIYLDELWNVVGFNKVAEWILRPLGDPRWFDRSEVIHVFDILCSDTGRRILSIDREESLDGAVLCFRANVNQETPRKAEYRALWNRLVTSYPEMGGRFSQIKDTTAKRFYTAWKKHMTGGRPITSCDIRVAADVLDEDSVELNFVCEIARNDTSTDRPSAFRVCLIPEDPRTELAVMFRALKKSSLESLKPLKEISNETERHTSSVGALLRVVSDGLYDRHSPARFCPVSRFKEELASQPSVPLMRAGSSASDYSVEVAISEALPSKWQMGSENHRSAIGTQVAAELKEFVHDGVCIIIGPMIANLPDHDPFCQAEPQGTDGPERPWAVDVELMEERRRHSEKVSRALAERLLTNTLPDVPKVDFELLSRRRTESARVSKALAKDLTLESLPSTPSLPFSRPPGQTHKWVATVRDPSPDERI